MLPLRAAENRKMVSKPFVSSVANTVVAKPDAEGLLPTALALGATLCFRNEAHKRVVYAEGAAKAAVEMLAENATNAPVIKVGDTPRLDALSQRRVHCHARAVA